MDNAIVEFGGRRFLIGMPAEFEGLSATGSRDVARLCRAASESRAFRRLYLRLHGARSASAIQIARWLRERLYARRLCALELLPALNGLPAGYTPASAKGSPRLPAPGGLLRSLPAPRAPAPSMTSLGLLDRAIETTCRAWQLLPQEKAGRLLPFLQWQLVRSTALFLTRLAERLALGRGIGYDPELLSTAFTAAGSDGFRALRTLVRCAETIRSAASDRSLSDAAGVLASVITLVGVFPLISLVSQSDAVPDTQAGDACARWGYYVTNLRLPFDGMNAALWSKLEGGEDQAERLARTSGRQTLKMVLSQTDFFDRYTREFGERQDATTKHVWELVSEAFVRQLQGTVIVYLDNRQLLLSLQKAFGESSARGPSANVDTATASVTEIEERESNVGGPVLPLELTVALGSNPKIRSVSFVDVRNPGFAPYVGASQEKIRAWERGHGFGSMQ